MIIKAKVVNITTKMGMLVSTLNILGFSNVLSLREYRSGELLDSVPLGSTICECR